MNAPTELVHFVGTLAWAFLFASILGAAHLGVWIACRIADHRWHKRNRTRSR